MYNFMKNRAQFLIDLHLIPSLKTCSLQSCEYQHNPAPLQQPFLTIAVFSIFTITFATCSSLSNVIATYRKSDTQYQPIDFISSGNPSQQVLLALPVGIPFPLPLFSVLKTDECSQHFASGNSVLLTIASPSAPTFGPIINQLSITSVKGASVVSFKYISLHIKKPTAASYYNCPSIHITTVTVAGTIESFSYLKHKTHSFFLMLVGNYVYT